MLILHVKPGEAVHVDGPAIVRFEAFTNSRKIKLSFDAPQTTKIMREEVLDRDRREASS